MFSGYSLFGVPNFYPTTRSIHSSVSLPGCVTPESCYLCFCLIQQMGDTSRRSDSGKERSWGVSSLLPFSCSTSALAMAAALYPVLPPHLLSCRLSSSGFLLLLAPGCLNGVPGSPHPDYTSPDLPFTHISSAEPSGGKSGFASTLIGPPPWFPFGRWNDVLVLRGQMKTKTGHVFGGQSR